MPVPIGNLLTEDITVSSGLTYSLSGSLLTLTKAAQVQKILTVQDMAKGLSVVPVPGSETGQQFLIQAYWVGATSAKLTELPSAGTGLQGAIIRVLYLGN